MEKVKTSDKIFKALVTLLKVLVALFVVVAILIFIQNARLKKLRTEYANSKLPAIESRIGDIVAENSDIYKIETNFEYKGMNIISVYVNDTWFVTADIQKKRFVTDINTAVKEIMVEEGFIEVGDRLGTYVYTYDGIQLASMGSFGEVKLKD